MYADSLKTQDVWVSFAETRLCVVTNEDVRTLRRDWLTDNVGSSLFLPLKDILFALADGIAT
jgi:hypothetical protein